MLTFMAQVWKGKEIINFYTIPEYEMWLEETPNSHKWEHKYFKVRAFSNHLQGCA